MRLKIWLILIVQAALVVLLAIAVGARLGAAGRSRRVGMAARAVFAPD